MKVVGPKQMTRIEAEAYRDGASETDYMEEAGNGVALVVHDYAEKLNLNKHAILLCGKGNNAGDAYVAGACLLRLDYHVVAMQLFPIDECSPLCHQNYLQFMQEGGDVVQVTSEKDISFPDSGIIIDGIFGTGFHGPVEEPIASVIRTANSTRLPIIAIDIPSGLDGSTGAVINCAIKATETAFLGLPKTGFFLQKGWNHVGKLYFVDFGLPREYIDQSDAEMVMLTSSSQRPLLPPIKRNRHKYEAGYVIGLAGSPGYSGAAILASLASLCGGAGIVRLLHPQGMENELVASPYELIKQPYSYEREEEVIETLNRATAVLIGPGIGRSDQARRLLRSVLLGLKKPCVIDADALSIIAEEDLSIPKDAVLTPHLGEMQRLLKLSEPPLLDNGLLKKCQSYAETHHISLLLKGGPSFMFYPGQQIRVNPRGDPGMATAGSGDILTGLIAALLAQGLPSFQATTLGCYLHGVAGEHAAEEMTSYSMIASDIIYFFSDAFAFRDNSL